MASLALGGQAGQEIFAAEVTAVPSAMLVEAIPFPSMERPRVADATSLAASPTTSEILLSLLDSKATDQGLGVAGAEEVGHLRWPKEPVLVRIALPPGDEVSSRVICVGRDPIPNHGPSKRIYHRDIPFRRACHDVVLFLLRA